MFMFGGVRPLPKGPRPKNRPPSISGPREHINIKECSPEAWFDVFSGGSRPQGHLPRLISDGLGPVVSTIRDPG